MIRELTKSALSFSWALALLGVKQAVNLGTPGQNGPGDLFAPVLAGGQRMEDVLERVQEAGESEAVEEPVKKATKKKEPAKKS